MLYIFGNNLFFNYCTQKVDEKTSPWTKVYVTPNHSIRDYINDVSPLVFSNKIDLQKLS